MITYIEKAHCDGVKIYYEKLVQHHKSILKRDNSKESKTVPAKGGHEIQWREKKEHPELNKDIALVYN